MAEIKSVKEPIDAKRIGDRIIENDHWKRIKIEKMIDILQHKFRQNKDLYFKLINTRPYDLIEASLDGFWGAYCKLYSIALEEGTWTGQNVLGRILGDIRTDLYREEEAKRMRSPHKTTHNQRSPTPTHGSSPMQVDKHTPNTISQPEHHNTRL